MRDRIETDNLMLRRLEMEDAEDMYEYTSMPEVTRYLAWDEHISVEQDKGYLKEVVNADERDSIFRGIVKKSAEKLIGCIHIYNISHKHKRAEITYILNPRYSGNGFATEAVRAVIDELFAEGFNRIQALCVDGNERSECLMKRCGMSYEGTLRDYAVLSDKKVYPMKIYSICRSMGEEA